MEPETPDGRAPIKPVEPAREMDGATRRWESIRQLGGNAPDADAVKRKPAIPPTPAIPAISTGRRRPQLWRRWQVWGAALVLVALAAGLAVALAPRQRVGAGPAHVAPPVQFLVSHDLIECPTDMAWSRNQRFIAVLGYTGLCPNTAPPFDNGFTLLTQGMYRGPLIHGAQAGDVLQGALAIYSAGKGALITQAKLDDAVYAHIQFPKTYTDWLQKTVGQGPEMMAAINYTHVLWSPDGQRLYVTFDIYVPDGPLQKLRQEPSLPGYLIDGLLVTTFQGGSPTVYVHRASSNVGGVTVWDVASGAVHATIPAASPFALSPAGQGYAWSGDMLTVQNPATPDATPTAPALGPVGAPQAGDSVFSVWQPGVVTDSLIGQAGGQPSLSSVPTFTTDFAALSPDGSLLAAGLGLSTVLVSSVTPAPAAKTLAAYGWGAAPHLPLRDAALNAAATTATPSNSGLPGSLLIGTVAVAWRPNGREMAMETGASSPNGAAYSQVTILSCATGKTLANLTPPPLSGGDLNQAQTTLLRWSPDGQSLAFFDSATGAITIWEQARLPS